MDADPKVSVELPLSAWIVLADMLGHLSYNEAAPYIAAIGAQVVPHIEAARAALEKHAATVAQAATAQNPNVTVN